MLVWSFFFFMRKMAYSMRISDWSSDVCSSDLHSSVAADIDAVHGDQCRSCDGVQRGAGLGRVAHGSQDDAEIRSDRKSVGSGKRVSARVDLGGRGHIKKKRK